MNDDFHQQQVTEATRQLTEKDGPPRIGVHTMCEYIFCKRSGLLTVAQNHDDLGTDFTPAPALGGIQSFEPDLIAAELEQHAETLKEIGAIFSCAVLVIAGLALFDHRLAVFLAGGGAVGIFATGRFWWWHEVQCYFHCRHRLRLARETASREPNWDFMSAQAVNWWGLLQSGFDSRRLTRALHNPEVNLAGKPWRILRRGDHHLPVIRIQVPEYDGTNLTAVKLFDKHRARIAAYSYLIETCEQGRADWAIVLYNNSDDGIAVPLGEDDWKSFVRGLLLARREVSQLTENPRYRPRPPQGRRQCTGCRFGSPRLVGRELTILSGTELPPFATSDSRGERCFHSTCGDCFLDVPPHRDAELLGLLK